MVIATDHDRRQVAEYATQRAAHRLRPSDDDRRVRRDPERTKAMTRRLLAYGADQWLIWWALARRASSSRALATFWSGRSMNASGGPRSALSRARFKEHAGGSTRSCSLRQTNLEPSEAAHGRPDARAAIPLWVTATGRVNCAGHTLLPGGWRKRVPPNRMEDVLEFRGYPAVNMPAVPHTGQRSR